MSTNMQRFILLRIPQRTKEHDSERSQGLHSDKLSTARRVAPRQDRGSLWTRYRAIRRGKRDFVQSMTAKAEKLGMNASLLTEVHVCMPCKLTEEKLLLIGLEEAQRLILFPRRRADRRNSMRRSTAQGPRPTRFLGTQTPISMCSPLTARVSAIRCWSRAPWSSPVLPMTFAGCNDAVTSESAILVPPYGAHALLAALIRLDKDALLRQNLGNKARWDVKERFSRKLVWGELASFYRQHLNPIEK